MLKGYKEVRYSMKILYVTDLHGDKNKYRKSLEIAMKQEIRVIVNVRYVSKIGRKTYRTTVIYQRISK